MAGDGPAGIDSARAGGTIPTDDAWCGLAWTAWTPLERAAVRRMAPSLSGVYRVRRAGGDPGRLVYVGHTARGLRERLLALAAGASFPAVASRLADVLRPGGAWYMSFKLGGGERVSAEGRLFVDHTEETLLRALAGVAADVAEHWVTTGVQPGRSPERWVNAVAIWPR